MDKLEQQLRDDAAKIDVKVSDDLDRRIAASLQGLVPEKRLPPGREPRPAVFWWASSLTGLVASLAVILFLNSGSQPAGPSVPELANTSPVPEVTTPTVDWKTESAMLTRPLQQELEDLQSDLEKVEQNVKKGVGL